MKPQFNIVALLFLMLLVASFFVGWQLGSRSVGEASAAQAEAWDLDPAVTSHIFESAVEFDPKSFHEDIEGMIAEGDYTSAIATMMLASENRIVELQSEASYCAINKCNPVIDPETKVALPGTTNAFDSKRDWVLPDSGYDSVSYQWDCYSRVFARRYNECVDAKFNDAGL